MTVKSKWRRLTVDDLKTCLAQDEMDKLENVSVGDVEEMLQSQMDQVADTFRASFQGKGWAIDARDHYLPSSYFIYALALARWWCWTRFPNSGEIALDEPRKALFESALKMLENPTLPTFEPDYSDSPELSGEDFAWDDASLTLPYQRILPEFGGYGFVNPYFANCQTSSKGLF